MTLGGYCGLGTTTPSHRLEMGVNDAAKPTSNTWTILSDRRLKKNIQLIEGALDRLMQLKGVTYQWIHPDTQGNMSGTYTGMIAQDVERVFPEWISEDRNGYKQLTVIGFEGLTVEALRDLRNEKYAQIAELQSENQRLEERLAAMEAAMARLNDRKEIR